VHLPTFLVPKQKPFSLHEVSVYQLEEANGNETEIEMSDNDISVERRPKKKKS